MKLKCYDKNGEVIQSLKLKDDVLSNLLDDLKAILSLIESHFEETDTEHFSDVRVVQIIDKKNEEDIKINVRNLRAIIDIMEEKNAVSTS